MLVIHSRIFFLSSIKCNTMADLNVKMLLENDLQFFRFIQKVAANVILYGARGHLELASLSSAETAWAGPAQEISINNGAPILLLRKFEWALYSHSLDSLNYYFYCLLSPPKQPVERFGLSLIGNTYALGGNEPVSESHATTSWCT